MDYLLITTAITLLLLADCSWLGAHAHGATGQLADGCCCRDLRLARPLDRFYSNCLVHHPGNGCLGGGRRIRRTRCWSVGGSPEQAAAAVRPFSR